MYLRPVELVRHEAAATFYGDLRKGAYLQRRQGYRARRADALAETHVEQSKSPK